jgi:hypothetical protein
MKKLLIIGMLILAIQGVSQETKTFKETSSDRAVYGKILQNGMYEQRYNIQVTVSGENNTNLSLYWPECNDMEWYHFKKRAVQEDGLFIEMEKYGFKFCLVVGGVQLPSKKIQAWVEKLDPYKYGYVNK